MAAAVCVHSDMKGNYIIVFVLEVVVCDDSGLLVYEKKPVVWRSNVCSLFLVCVAYLLKLYVIQYVLSAIESPHNVHLYYICISTVQGIGRIILTRLICEVDKRI